MTQLLVLPLSTIASHHPEMVPYRPNINIITDRKLANTQSSSFWTKRKDQNEALPRDFEPGPFDVICSQGKTSRTHAGNIYFQSVIRHWAKEYANALEKRNKSKIVRSIIEAIRTKSPHGGFVKKDTDGRWWIVNLEQAREKVSQSLRDTLAGRYRSSLTAKKRSRMESNIKRMIDFEEIVESNKFVSNRMQSLSDTIKNSNNVNNSSGSLSDSKILQLMTETNLDMLRQLKQDSTVQQKVQVQHSGQQECNIPRPPSNAAVEDILKSL